MAAAQMGADDEVIGIPIDAVDGAVWQRWGQDHPVREAANVNLVTATIPRKVILVANSEGLLR